MKITRTVMAVKELGLLPVFPFAAKFSMLSDVEMLELAQDIETNGLRYPPMIWGQDMILDGRNRIGALQKTGLVEVEVEILEGSEYEAASMVFSVNLLRRHLNDGQRAMMSLEFLPYEEAEAKRRQGARTDLQINIGELSSPMSDNDKKRGPRARDIVAEKANVSGRYLQAAKRIKLNAPDLAEKVMDNNDFSLAQAEKELKNRSGERDKKLTALEGEGASDLLRGFESGSITLDEAYLRLNKRRAEESRRRRAANPEALILIEEISTSFRLRIREFNLKIGQLGTTGLADKALDQFGLLETEFTSTKKALVKHYDDLLEEEPST